MNTSSKKVVFILPKLTGYGGLQIENIGFINALIRYSNLKVEVLTIEIDKEFKSLIHDNVVFYKIEFTVILKCLSIWFLKLLIKTRFNLKKSLRIYLERYPSPLNIILINNTKANDIIFCSYHPQNIVKNIQDFCNKNQRQFVFHQISEPHSKYNYFYESLTPRDLILISSESKFEKIFRINKKTRFENIKQWIYLNESCFLKLKSFQSSVISFGVICRLDKEKNLQLILKATKLIKDYNFKIKIYGTGNEYDNLNLLTKKFDICDKVFFKGITDFESRYKAYEEIDVFICSSMSEGGPITVLEAMASGIPVISTNVGDVSKRIVSNFNGYVLENNFDYNELSKLMLIYIKKTELIEKHGRNGRIRYIKNYHSKVAREIFVNKFCDIINSSNLDKNIS